MDSGIIFRQGRVDDGDAIFRVLESAFALTEGTARWAQKRGLAQTRPEDFVVLEQSGEVIAAAIIHRHWLRVGRAKVLKGDVGEVSVAKELHGQGLGTRLMRACVAYLRESGFHLSRLGGLTRFYSRFGYTPFPRRYYEFMLTEARAGATIIPPEELLRISPGEEKRVRVYCPHADWQSRDDLYERFNRNRTGSLVRARATDRPPATPAPSPESLNLVYEEDGEMLGYLFASQHSVEHSSFEGRVRIEDAAFELDRPEAFKALMRYVLRAAVIRGVERVTARLPFDPFIQRLLIESAVRFSLHELQSAPASNMMALVDLPELLRAIAPELGARRTRGPSCAPFSLSISVDGQMATLSIGESSVEVSEGGDACASLSCDTGVFVRWVLGVNGYGEWRTGVTHSLDPNQASTLAALFPREPCASGPWG